MKVAICDDNEQLCKDLFNMIEKYKRRQQIIIEADVFLSGKELLDNIKSGEYYNLIFMDIELGNSEYGNDIGNYLRDALDNQTTCIAYVSAYNKYAKELFASRPLDFIEKPITEEKIERIFNAYFRVANKEDMFIKVKVGFQTNIILCKDILYFYRERRKIYVITKTEKYETYKDFEELSKLNGFILIHKSYIVNANYIKAYAYNDVTLTNDTVLKISQSQRNAVREYMEDL